MNDSYPLFRGYRLRFMAPAARAHMLLLIVARGNFNNPFIYFQF